MVNAKPLQLRGILVKQALGTVPAQKVLKSVDDLVISGEVCVPGDGALTLDVVIPGVGQNNNGAGQSRELRGGADILIPHPGRESNAGRQKQAAADNPGPGVGQGQQQFRMLAEGQRLMIGKIIHKGGKILGAVGGDKAKGVDICGHSIHFLGKPLKGIRGEKIIAVQEKQIIPLGRFDAGIAGGAQSAVCLMDHPAMVLPSRSHMAPL